MIQMGRSTQAGFFATWTHISKNVKTADGLMQWTDAHWLMRVHVQSNSLQTIILKFLQSRKGFHLRKSMTYKKNRKHIHASIYQCPIIKVKKIVRWQQPAFGKISIFTRDHGRAKAPFQQTSLKTTMTTLTVLMQI